MNGFGKVVDIMANGFRKKVSHFFDTLLNVLMGIGFFLGGGIMFYYDMGIGWIIAGCVVGFSIFPFMFGVVEGVFGRDKLTPEEEEERRRLAYDAWLTGKPY